MRHSGLGRFWVLGIALTIASAEQLAIKTYTTADGLARNSIFCVVQDSHGFLWFCTQEGLSRFDGYAFTNYGTAAGLPNRVVNQLFIDHANIYWAATSGGLFRFDPNSSLQKFAPVSLPANVESAFISSVLEDRSGAMWAGIYRGGLYRLPAGSTAWENVEIGIPALPDGSRYVDALLEDSRGTLWVAGGHGLYRRTPDGRVTAWPSGWPGDGIAALYEDRQGRLWATDKKALYRLNPGAGPKSAIVAGTYTMQNGLPSDRMVALLATRDGHFWAAGIDGLAEYIPGADRFKSYTMAQGLSDKDIQSLGEDSEGNLWLGTKSTGVFKVARRGFTSYTRTDGLGNTNITSAFLDRAGGLCVVSDPADKWSIDCFDGQRFHSAHPAYPAAIHDFGWGWNQTVLQDHNGEWWIPTFDGLLRFPSTTRPDQLAGKRPAALYTTRDGLAGNNIFRLFEDSRGDIWISSLGPQETGLTRLGPCHRHLSRVLWRQWLFRDCAYRDGFCRRS